MKKIKIIFRIFIILVLFSSFFCFVKFTGDDEIKMLHEFRTSKSITGNEWCYKDENYVYLVDCYSAVIQIFNKDGTFRIGYQIPRNGGISWVGVNDKLYVYCVRTDAIFMTDGESYCYEEGVLYNSKNEFYSENMLNGKQNCKLQGKSIHYNVQDDEKIIMLDVKKTFEYSKMSVIILAISVLGLWFTKTDVN